MYFFFQIYKTSSVLLFILFFFAPLASSQSLKNSRTPESPTAKALIQQLSMQYLPIESGYFALREGSAIEAPIEGKKQKLHSSIYYLLTQAKPINYLHWLASDDVHILVDGGPLDYYLFLEDGSVQHVRLGKNLSVGEQFAVTVPARSYKAMRLVEGASHALMVNVLTPAWSRDRVRMGADETFLSRYANKAPWAEKTFLESLLPPDLK